MKELEGTCLSGSSSRLEISAAPTFMLAVCSDSGSPVRIPVRPEEITVCDHLVSLGRNPRVAVVEHLFSALYGLGVRSVNVTVYGNEIPFFDGSSLAFTEVLMDIDDPTAPETAVVPRLIRVERDGSYIQYQPGDDANLLIDMELSHPYIQNQRIRLAVTRENYLHEIAPARTFVFTSEDDPRLRNIPPYGIGITDTAVYSAEPLRFPDEPVRHKVLDLLGDLFVTQREVKGIIHARNTSHALNLEFVSKLCDDLRGDHEK